MDNKISWRFEDSSLWFVSTPETLNKHINKARRDLEIAPDTKIIYSNAGSTPSVLLDSGVIINGVSYKSMADFHKKSSKKTNNMSDVHDLVDKSIPTPTPLPTTTPDGNSGSGNFGPGL